MNGIAEIKRVDVWSLFKVAFVLYATLGVIAGLFYGLIFAVLGSLGDVLGLEDIPGVGVLSGVIGVLAVPVLAALYGIMGSIVIAVAGGLYNLAARWVGGIRVDLRAVDSVSGSSSTPPTS